MESKYFGWDDLCMQKVVLEEGVCCWATNYMTLGISILPSGKMKKETMETRHRFVALSWVKIAASVSCGWCVVGGFALHTLFLGRLNSFMIFVVFREYFLLRSPSLYTVLLAATWFLDFRGRYQMMWWASSSVLQNWAKTALVFKSTLNIF